MHARQHAFGVALVKIRVITLADAELRGVHEAIYCLLMMRDGFLAGSANLDVLDLGLRRLPDRAR